MTHFSQGIDLTVMPSPRMLNVDNCYTNSTMCYGMRIYWTRLGSCTQVSPRVRALARRAAPRPQRTR